METGGAGDKTVRIDRMRLCNLVMFFIFERGDGKFGPVVIRCADPDSFSCDFRSGFAEDFDQAFQPGIGTRRGIGAVFDRIDVRIAFHPFRRVFRLGAVVGAAAPVRPFKALIQISGVFKDLASIRDPEHYGNLIGGPDQIQPLREHFPADGNHGCFRLVRKRFGAEFQCYIFQMHCPYSLLVLSGYYTRFPEIRLDNREKMEKSVLES